MCEDDKGQGPGLRYVEMTFKNCQTVRTVRRITRPLPYGALMVLSKDVPKPNSKVKSRLVSLRGYVDKDLYVQGFRFTDS